MISEETVRLPKLGFSTRVLRSGKGAPVLLLHGSPDSAGEWSRLMEALGEKCACFAPDLPGLGKGEEPPVSFDYSRLAHNAFLDELLAGLGIREKVVLVVHDIGGVVGIPWAAINLERVRGLVITNTVVFEKFPWFALAKIWSQTGAAGKFLSKAVMWQLGWFGGGIFRKAFARNSPELSSEHLERVTREFACDEKSKRATLRLFRVMVPAAYFDGFAAMVRDLIARVPVRVVWGRGDPYIPPHYSDSFPGAEMEIVEHGGHWIPISAAERVAAAVLNCITATQ